MSSSFNYIVIGYCTYMCFIEVSVTSLETVVAEKDDPPSRRVGRPKSEFKFFRRCVLCVIGVINIL